MTFAPSMPPERRAALACVAALAAALPCGQALGQITDAPTPTLYLQAASARHHTSASTVGLTLPWKRWQGNAMGGQLRGYWDLYASQWSSDGLAGRKHTTMLGITPTLRLRPDNGLAAWFVEGGIGATMSDRRYTTALKEFPTRFNFTSQVGLGLSHGAQRQHEWVLRFQHVSNAGLKKPNPGEDFLQLRYALHF